MPSVKLASSDSAQVIGRSKPLPFSVVKVSAVDVVAQRIGQRADRGFAAGDGDGGDERADVGKGPAQLREARHGVVVEAHLLVARAAARRPSSRG